MRVFVLILLTCLPLAASVQAADGNMRQALAAYELDNCYGKSVALEEFQDKPIVVLAFLGTECPLAKLYGPRLSEIQDRFRDQGVQLIGINSNKQDSLSELHAYVQRYEINFPMLKDVGNRVADAVGATRTPEVLVLDSAGTVRYRGRIDDQYGVGYAKERSVQADLANAIDAVLKGEEIANPKTKAIGCVIGRVKEAEPTGEITFTKHIAPIMNAHCVECHREGEIGPFTLTSFEDLLGWEDTILEVIEDRRMPPWSADPKFGHFANDPRLSEEDQTTLRTWIANGMPAGDPADLPPAPKFVEGWRMGEPDQVFAMRDTEFSIPAEGVLDYERFVVDPGWTEDKFIAGAEARPGNRSVVHHILVYIIPPGARRADLRQVLVGYAPGSVPVQFETGTAMRIAAGSRLLFEMHYTPNGSAQTDMSVAGVKFVEAETVKKVVEGQFAIEDEFIIPAGASDYSVKAVYRAGRDELLLDMTPHMHLRGKSFRYEARYPDGTSEILLDVPDYDFNWQLKYILAEPKLLPRGTRVVCTAGYDNSEANLVNPDPSKRVRWGQQSWEEMMIGFMTTIAVDTQ